MRTLSQYSCFLPRVGGVVLHGAVGAAVERVFRGLIKEPQMQSNTLARSWILASSALWLMEMKRKRVRERERALTLPCTRLAHAYVIYINTPLNILFSFVVVAAQSSALFFFSFFVTRLAMMADAASTPAGGLHF